MARVRRTLDEVVIAAVVGVLCIALACVEGLRVPEVNPSRSASAHQVPPGDPVVWLADSLGNPVH